MENKDIKLIQCSRGDTEYQSIRERHYVKNNGCIGQQIHYIIKLNDLTVGIISGASSVWAVKARDNFFGLNKENKKKGLPSIINNVVFRLEYHEPNLATRVLSLFRKTICVDWKKRYGVIVHGFETFVVEEDYRKGALYRADNWTFLGETFGSTKSHHGLDNPSLRVATNKKLIFAIKVKNTTLSTEYTPTWNVKKEKYVHENLFEII